MVYMGSKNRIAKHLLPIMLKEMEEKGLTTWVEPFVGGGNMIDKVPPKYRRIGIDINEHAIKALIAIRDMVDDLPDSLSFEEYQEIRGSEPEPIKSWLRFVASFGGKFDGGYARDKKRKRNFTGEGKRNAMKQSPNLQGVELITGEYKNISHLKGFLIYCDPPYQNTTTYKTGTFNHEEFWDWVRMMSEDNSVFVSEYNAPSDFECVWEGEVKTGFSSTREGAFKATEKLFKFR